MAYRKASELCQEVKEWAKTYQPEFYQKIISNEAFFTSILNIEREKDKPRKDYSKYSDIYPIISFFYDDVYNQIDLKNLDFGQFDKEDVKAVLNDYKESIDLSLDEEAWFNSMKELSMRHGFADNVKVWKKNKEAYKGHVGDVTGFLRITLSGRSVCPNLYYIIQILGKEKTLARIDKVLNSL